MTTQSMFADLLEAQKEMPSLQKSGINPHFKNKYVPLEELLQTVVPILNKHNFVLLQMPCVIGEEPALGYKLLHVSGESISETMLLMVGKDDPQGQGSAITYARRYSLMSLLGLTADVDDDAEYNRARTARPTMRGGQDRLSINDNGREIPVPPPNCKAHGEPMRSHNAGISKKTNKPYSAFWGCITEGCKETVWDDDWKAQKLAEANKQPVGA